MSMLAPVRPPADPFEALAAAISPRELDDDDRTVSERFWAEVHRQMAEYGPRRPPRVASALRTEPPEQIGPRCIGTPDAPVCVPAPGGLWTCRLCGEHAMVTPVVGPRAPLCDCRPGPVCVHPVPRPARRAFPSTSPTR